MLEIANFSPRYCLIFRHFLIACSGFGLLTACGPSSSKLNYAHQSGEVVSASMPARLYALRQGLTGSPERLKVCIESKIDAPADQNVLLEVKLALAAWLDASVAEPDQAFAKFDFETHARCSDSDLYFALVVRRGLKAEADSDLNPEFNLPKMICQTQLDRTTCSTSLVRGFASSGAYSIAMDSRSQQWRELRHSAAARVVLNPHVKWHALSEEMLRNTKLADPIRNDIVSAYEKLMQKPESVSFESLRDLLRRMERHELIESPDAGFGRALSAIRTAERRVGSFDYLPESTLMHTLLHEMGHVFGMMHADRPDLRDITGESPSTAKNSAGQFVTENSVMAYGLPYLYLLADDKVGAAALDQYARNILDKGFQRIDAASLSD